MIIDKIKIIKSIIKNIDKGYYKDPIECIVEIYEIDMLTAIDLAKLNMTIIDEIYDYIVNNQTMNIIDIEKYLVDKNISEKIINFIFDRTNNKKPINDYIIKINHGYMNGEFNSQYVSNNSTNVKKTTKFIINNGKIILCDDQIFNYEKQSNHYYNFVFLSNTYGTNNLDKIFNNWIVAEQYDSKNNRNVISSGIITSQRVNELSGHFTCNLRNVDNDSNVRLWNINKNYEIDDKYLIFHSCLHKQINYNNKNSISESFTPDETLRIPLIDGLYMDTILGTVKVKQIKFITPELVNKWSDDDYEMFNK